MNYHFSNLRVYQSADSLVKLVYEVTNNFPHREIYTITDQLRRTSLSIVLNIVEGQGKKLSSNKDCLRFQKIALGSLFEVGYLISISKHLGYLSEESEQELTAIRKQCGAQLRKLIKFLQEHK